MESKEGNIIAANQLGFMKNRSCQINLMHFVITAQARLIRGKSADVISLGFSSRQLAWVLRDILIKKLESQTWHTLKGLKKQLT